MSYQTCPGDIDFSPAPGLISTGTIIPMEKGVSLVCTFMYIFVIFKLHLCMVTFISQLALGMANLRIRGCLSQRHVAGVLGVSHTTVARMWE